MNAIYIISAPHLSRFNIYKIGVHKGNMNGLLSRYRTYLIEPELHYFRLIQNNREVEKRVLTELSQFAIVSNNMRKTEWIQLPLEKIIESIECDQQKIKSHCNSKSKSIGSLLMTIIALGLFWYFRRLCLKNCSLNSFLD